MSANTLGALIGWGMGAYGDKPEVPAAPFVDPQAAQASANQGNKASLPTLEDIAKGVDSFNMGQRQRALRTAIPGYEGLTSGAAGVLGSWLGGQLSPDVQNAVERSSAAKALAGGYSGSPMHGNLTARDLGLTSLGLQQQGMSALPSYLGQMTNIAVPQPFDITSGFLSPGQQIGAQQWNEGMRFNQGWLQNQISALPDPAMAAIAGGLSSDLNSIDSMIQGFMGSAGSAAAGAAAGGGGMSY